MATLYNNRFSFMTDEDEPGARRYMKYANWLSVSILFVYVFFISRTTGIPKVYFVQLGRASQSFITLFLILSIGYMSAYTIK